MTSRISSLPVAGGPPLTVETIPDELAFFLSSPVIFPNYCTAPARYFNVCFELSRLDKLFISLVQDLTDALA